MVRWLIRHGAEFDARAFDGTPLAFAAAGRHLDAARLLVAAGADPHRKHGACQSPLERSAPHSDLRAVLASASRSA